MYFSKYILLGKHLDDVNHYCRRLYDRKFSEPDSSPWQKAQDKVKSWNTPPLQQITNAGVYEKPSKNGWSTPTLDTISVTPTFLAKASAGKPLSLPKPQPHPGDREADCVSPLSMAASSLYHQRCVLLS